MISIVCLDSKLLSNNNWYGRFQLAPFRKREALTIANALRRTLLAEKSNFYISWVDFYNAEIPYSVLAGMRESIFDILVNLKQIIFTSDIIISQNFNPADFVIPFKNFQKDKEKKTLFDRQDQLLDPVNIAYICVKGPATIYGKNLKLPKGLKCINPDQYIVTLSDDGLFFLRFAINNENQPFFNNVKQSNQNLAVSKSTSVPFYKKRWRGEKLFKTDFLQKYGICSSKEKIFKKTVDLLKQIKLQKYFWQWGGKQSKTPWISRKTLNTSGLFFYQNFFLCFRKKQRLFQINSLALIDKSLSRRVEAVPGLGNLKTNSKRKTPEWLCPTLREMTSYPSLSCQKEFQGKPKPFLRVSNFNTTSLKKFSVPLVFQKNQCTFQSPSILANIKKTCLVNLQIKHSYYKSGCLDRFLVDLLKLFKPSISELFPTCKSFPSQNFFLGFSKKSVPEYTMERKDKVKLKENPHAFLEPSGIEEKTTEFNRKTRKKYFSPYLSGRTKLPKTPKMEVKKEIWKSEGTFQGVVPQLQGTSLENVTKKSSFYARLQGFLVKKKTASFSFFDSHFYHQAKIAKKNLLATKWRHFYSVISRCEIYLAIKNFLDQGIIGEKTLYSKLEYLRNKKKLSFFSLIIPSYNRQSLIFSIANNSIILKPTYLNIEPLLHILKQSVKFHENQRILSRNFNFSFSISIPLIFPSIDFFLAFGNWKKFYIPWNNYYKKKIIASKKYHKTIYHSKIYFSLRYTYPFKYTIFQTLSSIGVSSLWSKNFFSGRWSNFPICKEIGKFDGRKKSLQATLQEEYSLKNRPRIEQKDTVVYEKKNCKMNDILVPYNESFKIYTNITRHENFFFFKDSSFCPLPYEFHLGRSKFFLGENLNFLEYETALKKEQFPIFFPYSSLKDIVGKKINNHTPYNKSSLVQSSIGKETNSSLFPYLDANKPWGTPPQEKRNHGTFYISLGEAAQAENFNINTLFNQINSKPQFINSSILYSKQNHKIKNVDQKQETNYKTLPEHSQKAYFSKQFEKNYSKTILFNNLHWTAAMENKNDFKSTLSFGNSSSKFRNKSSLGSKNEESKKRLKTLSKNSFASNSPVSKGNTILGDQKIDKQIIAKKTLNQKTFNDAFILVNSILTLPYDKPYFPMAGRGKGRVAFIFPHGTKAIDEFSIAHTSFSENLGGVKSFPGFSFSNLKRNSTTPEWLWPTTVRPKSHQKIIFCSAIAIHTKNRKVEDRKDIAFGDSPPEHFLSIYSQWVNMNSHEIPFFMEGRREKNLPQNRVNSKKEYDVDQFNTKRSRGEKEKKKIPSESFFGSPPSGNLINFFLQKQWNQPQIGTKKKKVKTYISHLPYSFLSGEKNSVFFPQLTPTAHFSSVYTIPENLKNIKEKTNLISISSEIETMLRPKPLHVDNFKRTRLRSTGKLLLQTIIKTQNHWIRNKNFLLAYLTIKKFIRPPFENNYSSLFKYLSFCQTESSFILSNDMTISEAKKKEKMVSSIQHGLSKNLKSFLYQKVISTQIRKGLFLSKYGNKLFGTNQKVVEISGTKITYSSYTSIPFSLKRNRSMRLKKSSLLKKLSASNFLVFSENNRQRFAEKFKTHHIKNKESFQNSFFTTKKSYRVSLFGFLPNNSRVSLANPIVQQKLLGGAIEWIKDQRLQKKFHSNPLKSKTFFEIPIAFEIFFNRRFLWNSKKITFRIFNNFIFPLASDRKFKITTLKPLFKEAKIKKITFLNSIIINTPTIKKYACEPHLKKLKSHYNAKGAFGDPLDIKHEPTIEWNASRFNTSVEKSKDKRKDDLKNESKSFFFAQVFLKKKNKEILLHPKRFVSLYANEWSKKNDILSKQIISSFGFPVQLSRFKINGKNYKTSFIFSTSKGLLWSKSSIILIIFFFSRFVESVIKFSNTCLPNFSVKKSFNHFQTTRKENSLYTVSLFILLNYSFLFCFFSYDTYGLSSGQNSTGPNLLVLFWFFGSFWPVFVSLPVWKQTVIKNKINNNNFSSPIESLEISPWEHLNEPKKISQILFYNLQLNGLKKYKNYFSQVTFGNCFYWQNKIQQISFQEKKILFQKSILLETCKPILKQIRNLYFNPTSKEEKFRAVSSSFLTEKQNYPSSVDIGGLRKTVEENYQGTSPMGYKLKTETHAEKDLLTGRVEFDHPQRVYKFNRLGKTEDFQNSFAITDRTKHKVKRVANNLSQSLIPINCKRSPFLGQTEPEEIKRFYAFFLKPSLHLTNESKSENKKIDFWSSSFFSNYFVYIISLESDIFFQNLINCRFSKSYSNHNSPLNHVSNFSISSYHLTANESIKYNPSGTNNFTVNSSNKNPNLDLWSSSDKNQKINTAEFLDQGSKTKKKKNRLYFNEMRKNTFFLHVNKKVSNQTFLFSTSVPAQNSYSMLKGNTFLSKQNLPKKRQVREKLKLNQKKNLSKDLKKLVPFAIDYQTSFFPFGFLTKEEKKLQKNVFSEIHKKKLFFFPKLTERIFKNKKKRFDLFQDFYKISRQSGIEKMGVESQKKNLHSRSAENNNLIILRYFTIKESLNAIHKVNYIVENFEMTRAKTSTFIRLNQVKNTFWYKGVKYANVFNKKTREKSSFPLDFQPVNTVTGLEVKQQEEPVKTQNFKLKEFYSSLFIYGSPILYSLGDMKYSKVLENPKTEKKLIPQFFKCNQEVRSISKWKNENPFFIMNNKSKFESLLRIKDYFQDYATTFRSHLSIFSWPENEAIKYSADFNQNQTNQVFSGKNKKVFSRSSSFSQMNEKQTKTMINEYIQIDIWTNGSISPRQSLLNAFKKLFELFYNLSKYNYFKPIKI